MTRPPFETVLARAVKAFGGTIPSRASRDYVEDCYRRRPEITLATIAKVARQANVRSPWGVLLAELERIDSEPAVDLTVDDRDHARDRAEKWMRVAGRYFPTWTELHDELFGERGKLRAWPQLEQHFHDLYDDLATEEAAA